MWKQNKNPYSICFQQCCQCPAHKNASSLTNLSGQECQQLECEMYSVHQLQHTHKKLIFRGSLWKNKDIFPPQSLDCSTQNVVSCFLGLQCLNNKKNWTKIYIFFLNFDSDMIASLFICSCDELNYEVRLLTHNQFSNILPVEFAALLMYESHCNPALDPLQPSQQILSSQPQTVWFILLKPLHPSWSCKT